jgi:DNA mismatch repair protein MutS
VPEYFVRRQTLTGAERYTTTELKTAEEKIVGAGERLNNIEYEVFCELRNLIAANSERIQLTAKAVAELDVYCGLAHIAKENRYTRPDVDSSGVIDIKEGRHPVIEQISDEVFVGNDTYLDKDDSRISIITGPNMAGKSTYMRQTALIVILAQVGSFVPAASARIGVVDRIFTRIGASDDLAAGASTFMVEMSEVSEILANATSDSLILLDEIGRGTSTYDGLAIARSVTEHIAKSGKVRAKTMFATHFHEMSELEGIFMNIKNYCVDVREDDGNVVFLRKIIRGSADRSYGVHVAKLAGLPESVIKKANDILAKLTDGENKAHRQLAIDFESMQVTADVEPEVQGDGVIAQRLRDVDLSELTPREALNLLYELQEMV